MKLLTWTLIPVLLLLQYQFWFAPGGIVSLWRVHRQLAAETRISQQWQQRNQLLITGIQDLKNGDQAIEDRARMDLGMVKPGETFYQIPSD